MDDRHNEILRSYMEKVLALRREREQAELSNDELERIALESGLGAEDLAYARKRLNDHLSRGKGFLQYGNWSRAAGELEQAAALSPNSVSTLVELGIALWNHGVTDGEKSDKLRAMQYAERALQLEASNSKAIRLVTHMTENPKDLFEAAEGVRLQDIMSGKQKLIVEPPLNERDTQSKARRTVLTTLAITMALCILGGLSPFLCDIMTDDSSDRSAPLTAGTDLTTEAVTPSQTPPTDAPGFARQIMAFGSEGIGPGRFNDARSIGTDGEGNIYVGEYGGGRVQVFDPSGTFITQWNMGDDFPMRGMAVGRDGTVFLVFRGKIHKYEGKSGKPLGEIEYDQGFDDVAVTPDGGVVAFWRGIVRKKNVPTGVSDDLIVFDGEGKVKRKIEKGVSNQSGGVAMSVRVAMDGEENIYALDAHSGAVFRFGRDGRFLNRFGTTGDEPGQFRAPGAIAVDGAGRVYVSDFKGVQAFDPDGRYLNVVDVEGAASGIAVTGKDDVLVVARDQVFGFALKR